jgi:single-stranded-DNA-specific exonuclease
MNSVSVTGKCWLYKKYDSAFIDYLKNNFSLDEITARLLAIKNIDKKEIQNYLKPAIKNLLPNPNILKDMEKTVSRALLAIENKEKIGIFGDYDVDGATSTALLGKYFSEINCQFEIYIPDRKKEGYGPSIHGFEQLIKKNSNLIFTVDCGTLSHDPINYALKKKIDTIVLDHHQSEVKLPKAYSIVNPNRLDDTSNLNYLCAAGVCFFFLIGLNRELRKINWFKKNDLKEPDLLKFLDLVSLGTICDVVPLIGINRALVKQGIKIMNFKKNIGLKTLLDICKIESKLTTYHLGYVLGPRINAGGRVGKCSHGANLLMENDPKNVFKLASELDVFNKERQDLEKKLLHEILSNLKDTSEPVIILSGTNWHEGIIGIVASRIKEKFNKPTIIISIKDNIGKASARSINGFDMGSLIIAAVQSGILIKGGGHKMAGGFSIEISKIDKFKDFANKKFNILNTSISKIKEIMIDGSISPSALNLEFFDKIDCLAPFGSGNSEPKFLINDVKTLNSKIVGEKHIKSNLIGKDGSLVKTIAFNATESNLGAYLLKKHMTFNIVGKLSLNEWRGKKNVEFIIDDISVNKIIENKVPSSIG